MMSNMKTVVAAMAAFGISGVAAAQVSPGTLDMTPYNMTFRAGVAIPIDRTLTDVGSVLVNLGLEYNLPRPLLAGGESYVALDYMFRGFGSGASGTVFPLTLNQRIYTGGQMRRSYYFFGAGVAFASGAGRDGSGLAVRGGIGQELGPNIHTEVGLLLSEPAGGVRANAFTFNVGYRF
jgi:hypothetical protein